MLLLLLLLLLPAEKANWSKYVLINLFLFAIDEWHFPSVI